MVGVHAKHLQRKSLPLMSLMPTHRLFVSDLVFGKLELLGKLYFSLMITTLATLCVGTLPIITKPSLHYIITESTISGRDVV